MINIVVASYKWVEKNAALYSPHHHYAEIFIENSAFTVSIEFEHKHLKKTMLEIQELTSAVHWPNTHRCAAHIFIVANNHSR